MMDQIYTHAANKLTESFFGAFINSVDRYDIMTVAALGIAEAAVIAFAVWLIFYRRSDKIKPLLAGSFLVTAISAGLLLIFVLNSGRGRRHAGSGNDHPYSSALIEDMTDIGNGIYSPGDNFDGEDKS